MTRYPDWQLRLEAFVRERRNVPFAWGSNDCALFVADAVQALTGEHLCPELRGHRDVREALRMLDRLGGLRGLGTTALGAQIPVLMANIGDVVVVTYGKREALALCNGGTALIPSVHGVVAVPMSTAVAAWRVG